MRHTKLNRKNMKYALLLMLVVACAACTPRQGSLPAADLSAAPAATGDALAVFAGANAEGATATLPHPGTGAPVQVRVGKSYMSALNMPCKQIYVRQDFADELLAVCQQGREWVMAPAIFSQKSK